MNNIYNTFDFNDLFTIIETKDLFPFNINFKVKENKFTKELGSGIYLISFNDQLLYLGSFSPKKSGNVHKIRWAKHIATITCRGFNVSLGSVNKWNWFKEEIKKNNIPISFNSFSNEIINKKSKDNGVVTSLNRVKYAIEKKDYFLKEDALSSSLNFKFFFFSLNFKNKYDIQLLENSLIKEFNPPCNFQFEREKPTATIEHVLNYLNNGIQAK
jgi:hypothetical protein